MRLRPYRQSDALSIGCWVNTELTNALWCANQLPYPYDAQAFEEQRRENEKKWSNACFVATDDSGLPLGYLQMGINDKENFAFLSFVIVEDGHRGKGCGAEMIHLAKKYAFEIANVDRIRLNVFDSNQSAIKCYQKNGFREVEHQRDCFCYKDELWGRYVMEVRKWF